MSFFLFFFGAYFEFLPMPVSLSFNYSYRSSLRVFYRSQVISGLVLALHYVISFERVIEYT